MFRFNFIERVPPIFRNKYILTLLIFILWILFLDSNNLVSRYKEIKNLKKLKADREYYLKRIEEDRKKLNELRTDSRNLEKFAREEYRMKKPDEDLYVILTPAENRRVIRKNN